MKLQSEAEPRVLPNLEIRFEKKLSSVILASFGILSVDRIGESFDISLIFNECFPELRAYRSFSWKDGNEYLKQKHYPISSFFRDYDITKEHHYDIEKDWVDLCDADLDIDGMIDVIQMIMHEDCTIHWAWGSVNRAFFVKWMVFFGQEDRKFVRDYYKHCSESSEYQQ